MPILKNHIQLISIQKNDLKEMFENDSIRIGKILPQYEVRFSFSNNILGIDNYNIELGFRLNLANY